MLAACAGAPPPPRFWPSPRRPPPAERRSTAATPPARRFRRSTKRPRRSPPASPGRRGAARRSSSGSRTSSRAAPSGRRVAAVSTDGERVVWLAYAGGNIRDWLLWTATPTARTPHRLRFRSADVDAPPPILLGNGGEGGIPYALGRDVIVIGPRGRRALFCRAPARVVALAQGAGKVGALLETGHLLLVGLGGG